MMPITFVAAKVKSLGVRKTAHMLCSCAGIRNITISEALYKIMHSSSVYTLQTYETFG